MKKFVIVIHAVLFVTDIIMLALCSKVLSEASVMHRNEARITGIERDIRLLKTDVDIAVYGFREKPFND